MTDEIISIIIKGVITIIVAVSGVLIPYIFQLIKAKIGADNWDKSTKACAFIKKIIISYFNANPDKEATAQEIYNKFKQEIIKIIPTLTSDEIDFLFKSIISDIAEELKLDDIIFSENNFLKFSAVDSNSVGSENSGNSANKKALFYH